MKKLMISALLATSSLMAGTSLGNLLEYDKAICLERLEKAEDAELWNVFLEGQANLFFTSEMQWIAKGDWWQTSKRILEIGSGNGAYLSRLADKFHEKTFQGIEILPQHVEQAMEHNTRGNVAFREGDAEILDTQLIDSADIVLFRLTLQHLKDPIMALKNAAHYLSSNGHVIIIDACDKARRTSHPIPAIDEALQLVAESQRKNGKGNRRVTLELLQTLENESAPLGKLYEVVFSNLDSAGNILCEGIRFEGERNRKLYFNHGLLLLSLMHRTYQIPIDLSRAYDELKAYLEDEGAWGSVGMHFFVLKKK